MTTTLGVILLILGGLVVVLILAALGAAIVSWVESILMRHYALGEQAQYDRDQERLRTHAIWFHEDEPTQQLLKRLADPGIDINRIRDKWRQNRNENAKRKTA